MKTLKANMIRYKLMEQHLEWVRSGKLEEAKRLLYLLRTGHICLGLGNEDWTVEEAVINAGGLVISNRRGTLATAYLK